MTADVGASIAVSVIELLEARFAVVSGATQSKSFGDRRGPVAAESFQE